MEILSFYIMAILDVQFQVRICKILYLTKAILSQCSESGFPAVKILLPTIGNKFITTFFPYSSLSEFFGLFLFIFTILRGLSFFAFWQIFTMFSGKLTSEDFANLVPNKVFEMYPFSDTNMFINFICKGLLVNGKISNDFMNLCI